MNCDGSGMELLSSDDVAAYLAKVECDPLSVVLTAPLPNCTDVYGITVLRPFLANVSQQWMKGYLLDSIIPPGVTSRHLHKISPGEDIIRVHCCDCCQLTRAGPPQTCMTVNCPPILEFRQLIKYNPVSDALRNQ